MYAIISKFDFTVLLYLKKQQHLYNNHLTAEKL